VSRQRRLGKGIDALLQGRDLGSLEAGDINSVVSVPLDDVKPNPDQPRKTFPADGLEELARSIEERGIIQPILAEQQDDGSYIIIAGERRYRAARLAGLTVVPVLPGVFSEDEKLEIALIENIQRQNLTPIEEARAYRELMERSGLNQEELAQRLGKSRSAVANAVRLLRLPEETQGLVNDGSLSAGHARTILALNDDGLIDDVTRVIMENDLSVRAVERLVALVNEGRGADEALARMEGGPGGYAGSGAGAAGGVVGGREEGAFGGSGSDGTGASSGVPGGGQDGSVGREGSHQGPRKTVEMAQIEQLLMERLGTRVVLGGSNDRGRIEIAYLSMDDLERLVELIAPGSMGG
jgi:ParB family transcriptional regulator, chromosome partitioning protein